MTLWEEERAGYLVWGGRGGVRGATFTRFYVSKCVIKATWGNEHYCPHNLYFVLCFQFDVNMISKQNTNINQACSILI